jgi:hypothetical protein
VDGDDGNFEGSGALGTGVVDAGAEINVAGGYIKVEVEGNAVAFGESPLVGSDGEVDGTDKPIEALATLAVGDERNLNRGATCSVGTLDQIEILRREKEAHGVVLERRLERGIVAIGRSA